MSNILYIQLKSSLLVCVALGLFLLPVSASAFFTDTETSSQQEFQASELQLDTALLQSDITLGVNQPVSSTTLVVDTTAASVPAAFDAVVVEVAGELDFCDNIQLQANNGSVNEQSVLGAFNTLEQTTFGAYELTFSLIDPSVLTVGETCTATVAVTAWQQNMNKGTGYHDTVEYQVEITAADLPELQLATSVTAEGEVAGARMSFDDPTATPTKKAAEPTNDATTPLDPATPDKKEPVKADSAPAAVDPALPAGDGETANGTDPDESADEAKPKPDSVEPPLEHADEAEVIDPKPPAESEESLEPVEDPEAEPTVESSPEEVFEPVSDEEVTEEEQPAAKQPEAVEPEQQVETDLELHVDPEPEPQSEPTKEPEATKPEVDESETETE